MRCAIIEKAKCKVFVRINEIVSYIGMLLEDALNISWFADRWYISPLIGRKIYVRDAPEPEDVNWSGISTIRKDNTIKIIFEVLIYYILLAILLII